MQITIRNDSDRTYDSLIWLMEMYPPDTLTLTNKQRVRWGYISIRGGVRIKHSSGVFITIRKTKAGFTYRFENVTSSSDQPG